MSLKLPVEKPFIPLSLEDSCLAWLVTDLEHYPPELLALLPSRLRYRLLANLPVLDLCRLEHTCVAEGVDLESIWEQKCSPQSKEYAVINVHQRTRLNPVNYIELSSLSWRERYLHAVATTILNNSPVYRLRFLYRDLSERRSYFSGSDYYTVVVDWLVSLKGYQFLNEDGDLESSYDWLGLASSFLPFQAEFGSRHDRLTPPRYAPYKSAGTRLSDEELITLLLRNCHFKPKVLLVLTARLTTVSELLLRTKACDILKEFLSEVEDVNCYVLDNLPNLPTVLFQSVFSSTRPKLKTLQVLDHLTREDFHKSVIQILADVIKQQISLETIYFYIETPYKDAVLVSREFAALTVSLSSFMARPQFHTLDLSRFRAPPDVTTDLLCAFLVSPCSHQQTMKLPRLPGHILPLHPSSKLDPVTHCSVGPTPVPDLGVEHKELDLKFQLEWSINNKLAEFYIPLWKTLLAFPRIRLRSLEVGCLLTTWHHINLLHMAAQHPDIQVKTLSIWLQHEREIPIVLPTLHDDMRALLQIPTLVNLTFPFTSYVIPGHLFLPILAQELPRRHHLAAIEELDLGRSNFLELPSEEVEMLFQSIFSLPRLSQLTLKLTCCIMSLQHYQLMHRLWTEHSSGERLQKLALGSAVYISDRDYTDGSSVSGIMSLLDSMAQSTDVTLVGRTNVKTDFIRTNLQKTD